VITVRRIGLVLAFGLLVTTVASPATAGVTETVRDEFNAIGYDGNNGTAAWSSDWREVPLPDGPTAGQIQVVADPRCSSSNCLRFGPDNLSLRGIYRQVDLGGASAASLSFVYRRELAGGGDGTLDAAVSTDGWHWTTVGSYPIDTTDSGLVTETINLSSWADEVLKVGFLGEGNFGGYMFVDNVEVAFSTNHDPEFMSTPGYRSNTEGESVNMALEATDADGDDLTFSATDLPPGLSIGPGSGVISGSVAYSAASQSPYPTTVTVTDSVGGTDTASFVWTIADLNRAPTIGAPGDVEVGEGSTMQVSTTSSDPDLPYDSLDYSLLSAPPGASINSNGLVTWTPGESDGPGTYAFAVKVADSGTPVLTATASFEVVVGEVNLAPSLAAIPDQANGVGDSVSIAVAAYDADLPANKLRYSAIGLPPGVSISSTSGLISGTIPSSAPQSNGTATVTVRDDGSPQLTATRTFSWQVTRGNHAPVLAPIPDQNPSGGETVSFTAAASDADPGDTLEFWLAAGLDAVPAGATINPTTGKFTWTPTESQAGATFRFNVGVSDSGSPRLSDTQLVTITVPRINKPPSMEDPGAQTTAEGETVTLAISATDPDLPDDKLQFRASGLPDGLRINSATGVIAGTVGYAAADDSPFNVVVTVNDDGSPQRSAQTRFEWTVTNTNRPPVAADSSVVALAAVPVDFEVEASDPDGDILQFTVVTPPAGELEGEGPEYTYTSLVGAGADRLVIQVSDGELGVEAEVLVEVRAANAVPTADTDMYDVASGEQLRIAAPGVLGNDTDLDAENLTAILVAAPEHGVVTLAADGSFTYTPATGFSGGDKFVYAATDAIGAEATATVVINVLPPVAAAVAPAIDDGPRGEIVTASAPTWIAADLDTGGFGAAASRAVVAAVSNGISSVPELQLPLLLLAIALVLGLVLGRLPLGTGKREGEGLVQSYDPIHEVGRLISDDYQHEVFVDRNALQGMGSLEVGQRIRFIASDLRGRTIALKVWPV
jgi:cold shock CspA family protein